MNIIRFVDSSGVEALGTDYDGSQATVLSGDLFSGVSLTQERRSVAKLLAPVEPRAIICIGLNYRKHAEETGMPIPEAPVVFMKNPAAAQNPGDPIVIPRSCLDPLQVDFEVELAVVIGKAAKNVSRADALKHVAGYTVANDVSARTWQKTGSGGQWIRGKSFDTFCPLGPVLVTGDAVPDPQTFQVKTVLNGEVMQDSNTADMIFPVDELISRLSEDLTLLPGTVLITGTPSGVGAARDPKVFLKPGDQITTSIDGIGELTNPVISALDA